MNLKVALSQAPRSGPGEFGKVRRSGTPQYGKSRTGCGSLEGVGKDHTRKNIPSPLPNERFASLPESVIENRRASVENHMAEGVSVRSFGGALFE